MFVSHLLLDQDVNIAVQTFICLVSNECLVQIYNVMTMLKLSSCLKARTTEAVLIKGLKNYVSMASTVIFLFSVHRIIRLKTI